MINYNIIEDEPVTSAKKSILELYSYKKEGDAVCNNSTSIITQKERLKIMHPEDKATQVSSLSTSKSTRNPETNRTSCSTQSVYVISKGDYYLENKNQAFFSNIVNEIYLHYPTSLIIDRNRLIKILVVQALLAFLKLILDCLVDNGLDSKLYIAADFGFWIINMLGLHGIMRISYTSLILSCIFTLIPAAICALMQMISILLVSSKVLFEFIIIYKIFNMIVFIYHTAVGYCSYIFISRLFKATTKTQKNESALRKTKIKATC